MNKESIQAILSRLSGCYISPLSKLYTQVEGLKKILFHQSTRVQIANPESWLYNKALNTFTDKTMSDARLELILEYLTNNGQDTVFSGDYALKADASIPYFEWIEDDKHYAISDFFGAYCFICLIENSSMEEIKLIKEYVEREESNFHNAKIILIGTALEKAFCRDVINEQENIYWVDTEQTSVKELSLKYKLQNGGFIKLFNAPKPLLLVSKAGKLLHLFSRQELFKLEEILSKKHLTEPLY